MTETFGGTQDGLPPLSRALGVPSGLGFQFVGFLPSAVSRSQSGGLLSWLGDCGNNPRLISVVCFWHKLSFGGSVGIICGGFFRPVVFKVSCIPLFASLAIRIIISMTLSAAPLATAISEVSKGYLQPHQALHFVVIKFISFVPCTSRVGSPSTIGNWSIDNVTADSCGIMELVKHSYDCCPLRYGSDNLRRILILYQVNLCLSC